MDSAPKISDSNDHTTSSIPGEFGRTLARRTSPQVTVIRRAIVQPGFIARRSVAFGSYVGQSQVTRWSIGATMSRGALTVRPPLDYWPWATTDEPAPVEVPRLERSLPRTNLLRRTAQPQPGAIVEAMRPEAVELAARGQSKEPTRSKMDLLRDMLVRTGELPESDDTGAPTATASHAAPGRDRFAPSATAHSNGPGTVRRSVTPAAASRPSAATTPWPLTTSQTSTTPQTSTTSQTPTTPLGAAADRAPTSGNNLAPRRNPSDQGGGPAGLAQSATATDSDADANADADTTPQPNWPANVTQPTITAQRAAEQLRSTRGPRPLPALVAPRFEQPVERRWGIDDTVNAQELAERLTSARAAGSDRPGSSPQTQSTSPSTTQPATQSLAAATRAATVQRASTSTSDTGRDVDAQQSLTIHPVTDSADSPEAAVAPPGIGRDRSATPGLTEEPAATLRRSLVEQHPVKPAAGPAWMAQPEEVAEHAAPTSHQFVPELSTAAGLPPSTSPAPSPALRPTPTPDSLRRSTPKGASLLLPSGETAAAPRTDGRERARQLPMPATRTVGNAAEHGLSTRSHDVLARPITPQPPDVILRSASSTARSLQQSPVTGPLSQHDVINWSDGEDEPTPMSTAEHATRVRPPSDLPAVRRLPDASATQPAAPSPTTPRAAAEATNATTLSQATLLSHAARPTQTSQDRSPATSALATSALATTAATTAATADPTTAGPTMQTRTTPQSSGPGPVAPTMPTIRPTPDRFLDVLRATSAPSPRPLPARFAPLARAIVGHTDVLVRHDAGSQAALAAVGKRAATVGNTIHLAEVPHGATATMVLAHELTHVANPTLAPRFFDDERQSVEERRADAVAQLIQRSPSLLTAAGASAQPLGRTGRSLESPLPDHPTPTPTPTMTSVVGESSATPTGTIRRSLAAEHLPPPPPRFAPSAPGSTKSAARDSHGAGLIASSSAGVAGGLARAATVRRSVASPSSAQSAPQQSEPATIIRRTFESDDQSPAVEMASDSVHEALPARIAALTTPGGVVDFVDWIVEQVEDRVVAEFQRRGGRFREDF